MNSMENRRFNAFSAWLRKRHGCRVRKISLTTDFGCPNRDGTIGTDGCFFCDENMAGFDRDSIDGISIEEQLNSQLAYMKSRSKEPIKFMSYLQSGTNTHCSADLLDKTLEIAVSPNDVVALSVSTRPDCITKSHIDVIKHYANIVETWVELGIQSSLDKSLKKLGRNHSFEDSKAAIKMIRQNGIFVCVHLILGIPGETKADMISTIEQINNMKVDGAKFHPLSVTSGAEFINDYNNKRLKLFDLDDYVTTVSDLLEFLDDRIVVQRLVGGGRPEVHIAPEWVLKPSYVIRKIEWEMEKRGTRQGIKSELTSFKT